MSRHRLIEAPARPRHRLEEDPTTTLSPAGSAGLPTRGTPRRGRVAVVVLGVCCVPLLAALLVNTDVSETAVGPVATELVAKHRSDSDSRRRRTSTASATPTTAPTRAPASAAGPSGTTAPTSAKPATPAAGQGSASLFGGPGSPWTQTIAAGAAVDPGSAAMVRGLSGRKFQMSHELWTVPVYYADKNTPRSDVRITSGWQSASTLKNVPIPAGARPDPSEDAHMSVVDRSTGCVYDFWGASRSGSRLSAMTANAIPVDSDGIYPDGNGTRGSGFSAAAGIVTADDLRSGSIDHALVFAAPTTRSGGPVAPASKSDGRSSGSGTIPEGARLRLDPSIDLTSLGLTSYELMIATAMQKYGMILGDTSGGFTIYSQHPQSLPAGAFDGLLPDDTWVDLAKIPTNRLQVMKLPKQTAPGSGPAGNRCNGF